MNMAFDNKFESSWEKEVIHFHQSTSRFNSSREKEKKQQYTR